jgi:hypothetical protein
MIIKSTVGKIDAVIGRFEGPILAFMEKEEGDFAKNSLKKELYNVKTSKHYSESITGMTGIGDFVATDGAVPYDDFEEGYSKTFIHQVFQKGIEIKRETIDDARIIDMENQAGTITDAANRTMEKFVHAPFVNAKNTSFTLAGKSFESKGSDGLALAHATHPSKTGKGSNQSNIVSAALSVDALKTAEEAMIGFKTDIGEIGNFVPDTLFVPYALKDTAYEINYSLGKLNTANNNANPYQGKYRILVSKWLDVMGLTADCFLIDSKYMKKCLYWLDRVPLEIRSQKDFNTQNWQIAGYMRYSLGFTDWRWLVYIGG